MPQDSAALMDRGPADDPSGKHYSGLTPERRRVSPRPPWPSRQAPTLVAGGGAQPAAAGLVGDASGSIMSVRTASACCGYARDMRGECV